MPSQKAYILAFQKATNYGALLQIYALKTILENFGLEVVVINYMPSWMKVTLGNQPSLKSYVKRKVMNVTFGKFFKKLGLVKSPCRYNHSLAKNYNDGDYYFVGSDQVWNEKIIGQDLAYFLDFAPPKAKKIAYAVSMGNNKLSSGFEKLTLPFISRFSAISGREKFVSGFVERNFSNVSVPVVVDPTLLLTMMDYDKIRNHKVYKNKYIALYAAMHDDNLYKYAKCLSYKTGLPIVNLGYHFGGADIQEYIYGPENWLNRISSASYIITNSFHGTVFSVLYKKVFFVIPNQDVAHKGLNARFTELLESLYLDERLVSNLNDIDLLINKGIDYTKAFDLLEKRKEESTGFIRQSILVD